MWTREGGASRNLEEWGREREVEDERWGGEGECFDGSVDGTMKDDLNSL